MKTALPSFQVLGKCPSWRQAVNKAGKIFGFAMFKAFSNLLHNMSGPGAFFWTVF